MASKQSGDQQYWADILSLFSQGYSYPMIGHKMSAKTEQEWGVERVRSIVRQMRTSPNSAGIPPLGHVVKGDLMKGDKRILVLSDLHEPDALPIVDQIVKAHKDWDGIHYNGDLFNMDYVSSHKGDKQVPLTHEFISVHARLKREQDYFGECLLSPGNHEWRLKWYFQSKIDPNVKFILDDRDDPLTVVVRGFKVKSDTSKNREFEPLPRWQVTDWWFTRYGDAVIAHPHDFLRLPLRTVQEADAFFRDWGMNHRFVCIGHTHKAGTYSTDTFPKRRLVESGCLTKTHDYQVKAGKLRYRPQSIGYVELYLWNGEVDLDRTRQVQVN